MGVEVIGRNLSRAIENSIIDGVVTVTDKEAIEVLLSVKEKDGLDIGLGAALNLASAAKLANKLGPGHSIVTIVPDCQDDT